jgi:hypothetical protein
MPTRSRTAVVLRISRLFLFLPHQLGFCFLFFGWGENRKTLGDMWQSGVCFYLALLWLPGRLLLLSTDAGGGGGGLERGAQRTLALNKNEEKEDLRRL